MNRPLNDIEQDRIWRLFHSISTADRSITNPRSLGMAVVDLVHICCWLAHQHPEQAGAAKKILRSLLSGYDQSGAKTVIDQIVRTLGTQPAEIAELASSHLEVQKAFPVMQGDSDE